MTDYEAWKIALAVGSIMISVIGSAAAMLWAGGRWSQRADDRLDNIADELERSNRNMEEGFERNHSDHEKIEGKVESNSHRLTTLEVTMRQCPRQTSGDGYP